MQEPVETPPAAIEWKRVVLAAVVARALLIFLLPAPAHSDDVESWRLVGELLEKGMNPYAVSTVLNWPPFWMTVVFGIHHVAAALGLPFLQVLLALLVLVDSVVIVLTLRLARRLVPEGRRKGAVLVGLALSPMALLLTCQHGNFDAFVAIWVLLFVERLVAFHRGLAPNDWLLACLCLGVGIYTKTIPLYLAPLLMAGSGDLSRKLRVLGAFLVLAPVGVGMTVLFALAPQGVFDNVLSYRSYPGYYGITGILNLLGLQGLMNAYTSLSSILMLGLALALGWALCKRARLCDVEVLLLSIVVLVFIPLFGPGYSSQYLAWYLPLLVVSWVLLDSSWRRALAVVHCVGTLTYLVEYALIPSHGMSLVHLTNNRSLFELGESLGQPEFATLLRLPLFASTLVLFWMAIKRLSVARAGSVLPTGPGPGPAPTTAPG